MTLLLVTGASLALNVAFLYRRPAWALVAGVLFAIALQCTNSQPPSPS